eukprot:980326-Rhodomonas_salina.1
MHVGDLLKELKREFLPSGVAAALANDSPAASHSSSSSSGLGLSAMLRRSSLSQTQVDVASDEPDSPE